MPAPLGLVLGIETEMEKRVVVGTRRHHYVAATASVASARAAPRHKFFAPEREAAVAAIARFYRNNNFVNKHDAKRKRPANF
jgi:hypothetical protein